MAPKSGGGGEIIGGEKNQKLPVALAAQHHLGLLLDFNFLLRNREFSMNVQTLKLGLKKLELEKLERRTEGVTRRFGRL